MPFKSAFGCLARSALKSALKSSSWHVAAVKLPKTTPQGTVWVTPSQVAKSTPTALLWGTVHPRHSCTWQPGSQLRKRKEKHKHKQIWGRAPDWVGDKNMCMCFLLQSFLVRKGKHINKIPPAIFRDNSVKFLFLCSLLRWLFRWLFRSQAFLLHIRNEERRLNLTAPTSRTLGRQALNTSPWPHPQNREK